ncbi:MAG: 4a-hydroxytetrahydrobiopterin dehydratase [Patescibacteria group bacterium]|nr:MAG: 4a-hydroxytetrahydrobiopterin dehydratase [Patescibacteria group bacterium]
MQTVSKNILSHKHCIPCEGGVDPLKGEKLAEYTSILPEWIVMDKKKIEKDFVFKNFQQAVTFINKIADVAEAEGHHPDIFLHNWRKVKIMLTTHAIKGLSENDFILAAKVNKIYQEMMHH